MKCMAKDAMDSDCVCRQLRRTLAVQDAIRSTQTDTARPGTLTRCWIPRWPGWMSRTTA